MGEPGPGRSLSREEEESLDGPGGRREGAPAGVCVRCGDPFDAGEGGDLEAAAFAHFRAVHRSAEPLYAVTEGETGAE